jgi:hypothetical protein
MRKGVDLRSPLTVIFMTIVLLALTGAVIMVTVALEWLPPVWGQMAHFEIVALRRHSI